MLSSLLKPKVVEMPISESLSLHIEVSPIFSNKSKETGSTPASSPGTPSAIPQPDGPRYSGSPPMQTTGERGDPCCDFPQVMTFSVEPCPIPSCCCGLGSSVPAELLQQRRASLRLSRKQMAKLLRKSGFQNLRGRDLKRLELTRWADLERSEQDLLWLINRRLEEATIPKA